jgi:hypothetical protein
MYETPVETQHDLARIVVASGTVREMPGIFQRVQHNIASGAEYAMKSAAAILNNFYNLKQL